MLIGGIFTALIGFGVVLAILMGRVAELEREMLDSHRWADDAIAELEAKHTADKAQWCEDVVGGVCDAIERGASERRGEEQAFTTQMRIWTAATCEQIDNMKDICKEYEALIIIGQGEHDGEC